jgi:murein L,D-transpeptidase YafK
MARGRLTVAERLEQFGLPVGERLGPAFDAAGVKYPPAQVAFLGFKDTKVLQLYARVAEQEWRFIKEYPVLGASGLPGPKLREGDHQVPEGVYRLELLNPNSRFHLSVRLNYPNEFDRRVAQADGRTNLGGDIMIHGSNVSVGCLAIGDTAAEEVFVLSALVGKENVNVIVSPTDFRKPGAALDPFDKPGWVRELYDTIRVALRSFPQD